MKLRFLETGFLSAAENMAIDESVLDHIAQGTSLPTLRLYGWKPAAISIGYFQSLEEEIDLRACTSEGVDYVRRITGGGAVLHEHEITYSTHLPESLQLTPAGILESYEAISRGVILGLEPLGIQAVFAPLNDLVVNHRGGLKKISGNAQTRKKGIILQHGTILLKVDVEKMFSLLKVPSEKLKGKLIADIKDRVTSLSDIVGRDVSFYEALNALKYGFLKAFPGVSYEESGLSPSEKSLATKLKKEKYGNDEWNRKR